MESLAKTYGAQSMIAPLRRVLVKRPGRALSEADPKKWHYPAPIDLAKAQEEHRNFVSLLSSHAVEVTYHYEDLPNLADAIFVHDPVLVTDKGMLVLRMGKILRRGEEEPMVEKLFGLGIPVLARLHGNAIAEAGDAIWLDEKTLLIGRGYRTNQEGIAQITAALKPLGVEVLSFDLPHFFGPEACLHLQSLVSLVDARKALVYGPLMPAALMALLDERGFSFIEVPKEEFATQGPNVLAVRPGLVIALEGNPTTKSRLETAGVQVLRYVGNEISHKTEGGATCLTRPLLRETH